MQEADDFSLNPVLEKAYFIVKLAGQWSGRPVLTNEKRPCIKGYQGQNSVPNRDRHCERPAQRI